MSTALIAREFALADTPDLCEAIGLDWPQGGIGYGLLFCEGTDGSHWTVLTPDPDYVQLLIAANGRKALAGMQLPAEKFPLRRPGWPDEWSWS